MNERMTDHSTDKPIHLSVRLLSRWKMSFDILSERGAHLARIEHKRVFSTNYRAEIKGRSYYFRRGSFFKGYGFDLVRDDSVIGKLKYRGGRKFEISLPDETGREREIA
ncbi:MAG: hypothetical protein H6606_04545 [Flavobacteriales bacterium]|nr:hypothetical protein [Flavobacteriales bacterium]